MPFAPTWMELEEIMLSISEIEKDKYYMISYSGTPPKKTSYNYREQNGVCQRQGMGGGGGDVK